MSEKRGSERDAAVAVVAALREAGHESYFVGGCVREMLLQAEPKDHDLATAASPDEVETLFPRTVPVGKQFGIITVVQDGHPIEVASFRNDGSYSDGRRPDRVEPATAVEDVQRRDFTINALLYDPLDDRLVDHVGGRADLEARRLRTVGDPRRRFAEDHLRVLRAVRFASRLDFTLDDELREAARELAPSVAKVSVERRRAELDSMLVHPSRVRALELMAELGLVMPALPMLVDGDELGAFEHGTRVVAELDEPVDVPLAWAALLSSREPGSVDDALRSLRFATDDRRTVGRLLQDLPTARRFDELTRAAQRRLVAEATVDATSRLARAVVTVEAASTAGVDQLERELRATTERALPPPFLTGDDLRAAGIPPGPAYATLLTAIQDEQLEGRLTTREEALAELDRRAGDSVDSSGT
ncbi:MAG: hypothetical protein AAF533_21170 [Acidobacteriota bacterium]